MEEIELYGDEIYGENPLKPYIDIYRFFRGAVNFVGGLLADSPHLEELQQGLGIIANMPDDVEMLDLNQLQKALSCFDTVDTTDKLYVQCVSWYYKAGCYAMMREWEESYKMIEQIDNIQVKWDTVKRDVINERKAMLPGLLLCIRFDEVQELKTELVAAETQLTETKVELQNVKTQLSETEAELKKAEEEVEELRKRMIKNEGRETGKIEGKEPSLPIWAYITISTLLVAITVLVCYIVLK